MGEEEFAVLQASLGDVKTEGLVIQREKVDQRKVEVQWVCGLHNIDPDQCLCFEQGLEGCRFFSLGNCNRG